jgi:hypothetical protein
VPDEMFVVPADYTVSTTPDGMTMRPE